MRGILTALLVLCFIAGAGWCLLAMSNATGAVQEIEGLIGALIATVAISAGYVVSAVDENGKKARGEMPVVVKK